MEARQVDQGHVLKDAVELKMLCSIHRVHSDTQGQKQKQMTK